MASTSAGVQTAAPATATQQKETASGSTISTGSFSGWLQRVRQTGEFSDVIVEVEGQEFHLHMLPLLNASLFFRGLPNTSSSSLSTSFTGRLFLNSNGGAHHDDPRRRVILHDELVGGAKAFSVAADFCYLIKPNFTLHNVARIRAAAEYLGMADLLESSKKFLYANVFSHWRACVAFLLQYKRMGSPAVDEYMETRCLKVITAACVKAFFDTKYLSAPIALTSISSSSSGVAANTWQSSPSQMLTDILVRTCSLQDEYVAHIVEELVSAEVNLNLKCRQGRNVKGWLDCTIATECRSPHARCWLVICLARMLEESVTPDRPWLELSSQYWCSLLHHVGCCLQLASSELSALSPETSTTHDAADPYQIACKEKNTIKWVKMVERLASVNCFLEQRIGGSLHELDEYLLSYKFQPQVLLSLVGHFRDVVQASCSLTTDHHLFSLADQSEVCPIGVAYDLDANDAEQGISDAALESRELILTEKAVEEVALEVNSCLWTLVQDGSSLLSAHDFIYLVQSFPPSSRKSHDSLYAAIEKLLEKFNGNDRSCTNGAEVMDSTQINALWGLVDANKLSSQYLDKALSNPVLLCQPEVMEHVLHQHSQDLQTLETATVKLTEISNHGSSENGSAVGEEGQNLKGIIQKVVKASLKLIEENSRRSMEIMELQKQYTELLQCSGGSLCVAEADTSATASVTSTSSCDSCISPQNRGADHLARTRQGRHLLTGATPFSRNSNAKVQTEGLGSHGHTANYGHYHHHRQHHQFPQIDDLEEAPSSAA